MAKPPRNMPSSIDRLDPEVQERIAELRRQGRTIDEILDALKQLDVAVSRSALGRHVKSMAEVGAEMRQAEAMAKFVVEQFGDESDERLGRASLRLLQGSIFALVSAKREDEDGQPITLSADEAKNLALSLQRIMAAQSMDAERQLKLRAAARAEAAKDAAAAVKDAATAKGLSSDTADFIMQKVLGVAA